ncbi:MAG: nitroreductase family protein [Candidatus Marinimicrobia bacterium]|nr:nitroreductase family protein [Candidatus Neomarinimicrobiota bacterium]
MTFSPLKFESYSEPDMIIRSEEYRNQMLTRRTVRDFSDKPVPQAVIRNAIAAAASAPSGANKQPWFFSVVGDAQIKKEIRIAAEKEEKEFYSHRAPNEWLKELNQFGTDWHKPFLETAPYLIVVFKQIYEQQEGDQKKNYYVNESVGIATGFLLAALHYAGLATLTHTPSPMGFLQKILKRPDNERAFLLIPVGYPANDAEVPTIRKKRFSEVYEML